MVGKTVMENEVDAGLKLLKDILQRGGKLSLKESQPLQDGWTYSITVGDGQKQIELPPLSREFLSDLPGTPNYPKEVDAYARSLEKRIKNPSPRHFYCKSGVPLEIVIEWPLQPMYDIPGTGALLSSDRVRVRACNLRDEGLVSIFWVVITHAQRDYSFNRNPFLREKAIVRTVRNAVDRQQLQFFPQDVHPDKGEQIRLEMSTPSRAQTSEIYQFLRGKVFWLAFQQGFESTQVWIADPWDAEYLGVDQKDLIRTAQSLKAQGFLVLDSSAEFASAGQEMLKQADSFQNTMPPTEVHTPDIGKDQASRQWDLFICHATEDKEDFVRLLAGALREIKLEVWYDDFTLQMGDSLRRSIDKGLASSRYGVVVLSPAFFAKQWPQWELDGLVAREIKDGKKVILPVWHNIVYDDVVKYSPSLADKKAFSSQEGINTIVARILEAIRKE